MLCTHFIRIQVHTQLHTQHSGNQGYHIMHAHQPFKAPRVQPHVRLISYVVVRFFWVGCHLNVMFLRCLLLARTLDDVRQVTYGNIEREVERCEHDGEEDPPAGHGCDEAACSTRLRRSR